MKAYDVEEVQLPSFSTPVLDEVSSRLDNVKKVSRYPFFRKFCWPQSHSGLFWTVEALPIPVIEPRFFDFAVGSFYSALRYLTKSHYEGW